MSETEALLSVPCSIPPTLFHFYSIKTTQVLVIQGPAPRSLVETSVHFLWCWSPSVASACSFLSLTQRASPWPCTPRICTISRASPAASLPPHHPCRQAIRLRCQGPATLTEHFTGGRCGRQHLYPHLSTDPAQQPCREKRGSISRGGKWDRVEAVPTLDYTAIQFPTSGARTQSLIWLQGFCSCSATSLFCLLFQNPRTSAPFP